jgi:hypothetical protein
MSDEPEAPQQLEPAEQVDGELVLWRVFGLSDVHRDRPSPHWRIEENRGPSRADRLAVFIGDLPDDLTLMMRQWSAHTSLLLELLVGNSLTPEDQRARYEQELASVVLLSFEEPHPN